jgi:uncharacterized protein
MKIVLDTNVLIAAFITRGICRELLEHCVERHQIIVSDFILNELFDKLKNKFHFDDQEINEVLSLLATEMQMATPMILEKPVCRDSTDDMILATALAANAECIITGDEDLLILGQYGPVRILRPSQFVEYEGHQR